MAARSRKLGTSIPALIRPRSYRAYAWRMSIPDPDRPALKGAWPIICHLICLLQARTGALAAGGTTAPLWPLLRLTRVAESLVRRWLVLKACVEGWPEVRVVRKRSKPPTPAQAGDYGEETEPSRNSHQPLSGTVWFHLAEPLPRMPVWVWQAETETWCLVRSAPGARPSSLPVSAVPNPANLIQRCAALRHVMAHPDAHVRRMACWLARAAEQRKTGPGRTVPLCIGAAPGASKQEKRRDPERQNMLSWLDHLAREAVAKCGGP